MNILVCFKIIENLELIKQQDINIIEENQIDVSYLPKVINCFDESALEIALKLSDMSESFNCNSKIDAITVDNNVIKSILKGLYALKYDNVINVTYNENINLSSEFVADIIVNHCNKNKYDILMFGKQNGVGNNKKTPYIVTERLRYPCISEVISVELVDDCLIKVVNIVDGGGIVEQVIKPPVTLIIGNAENTYLRIPTFKDRMKYGNKEIIQFHEETTNAKSAYKRNKLLIEYASRNKIKITGENAHNMALSLYDLYLKERLKNK